MDSPILYGISLFLTDTPWYVVACVPFWKDRRVGPGALAAIILAVGLLKAAVGFALAAWMPDWQDWRSLHQVLHILLILAVYAAVFRMRPAKLLYTLLLLNIFSTIVNFSAYLAVAPFFPPDTAIGIATTWEYTLAVVIGITLTLPFVWWFFRRSLRTAFEELSARSIRLLCVTPILFVALSQIFVSSVRPSDSLVHVSTVTTLILIIGLVIVYTGLRTVLDNARHIRLEAETQTRLALQAQNYENLTQSIEAARAARHDLRHHLSVIRDFVGRDDKAGLLQYLDEYTASLPTEDSRAWCENPAVNALLKHYLARAAKAGAHLDVKLDLPARAGVPDTALCVVFGNIFENAATHASVLGSSANIRARCETTDTDIVLTVDNTIAPDPPHGQGLGLKNVQATAKKYRGSARFNQDGARYRSEVLLRKADTAEANTERKRKG